MEMESTGDLLSIVNDINEMKVAVEEEVNLELVDEHLAEKEKEINDRYDKFDNNSPEGWKDEEAKLSNDSVSVVSIVNRKATTGMDENFVENPEESNDSEQEVSIVIRKATAEMDEMSGK